MTARGGTAPVTTISFVMITGLSGAGKSYAIKCFEDMGFFCVDNMPSTLIPTFADLVARSPRPGSPVALGVDVREGEYFSHLLGDLQRSRRGHRVEVPLPEVRRVPGETLSRDSPAASLGARAPTSWSHCAERTATAHLRDRRPHHRHRGLPCTARARLAELYRPRAARTSGHSLVCSASHGPPVDADLVFDVRFLPNPHFVDALRPLDGRDERVRSFVLDQEATQGFLARLHALLEFVLPWYQREGKAYLTIAIGCTGGRHRSVALVEDLRRFLTGLGFAPTVMHRDLERE
jgi:UPF0042 nucleotide-binding protein